MVCLELKSDSFSYRTQLHSIPKLQHFQNKTTLARLEADREKLATLVAEIRPLQREFNQLSRQSGSRRNRRLWPTEILGSVATKITDGEHLNPKFVPIGFPIVMDEKISQMTRRQTC
jgi:hypothetical protein